MKSLMDICINWGKEDCHPDIRKWRYAQEIKEGEEIPIRPVKKKQMRSVIIANLFFLKNVRIVIVQILY